MLDILVQAAAAFLVGAAVGYGVAAIVDALSRTFAEFWRELVQGVRQVWGYVTEATEHFLALVAQWLDQNWPEIKSVLRQTFGYIRDVLVFIFQQDNQVYMAFANRQGRSSVIHLAAAPQNAQIPTLQNARVNVLSLS